MPTDINNMAVEREILNEELMQERKRNDKINEIMAGVPVEIDTDERIEQLKEFAKSRKVKLKSWLNMSNGQQVMQYACGNNVFMHYKSN